MNFEVVGLRAGARRTPILPAELSASIVRLSRKVRPLLTVVALGIVILTVAGILTHSSGFDAHAYWAADAAHPYGGLYETRDAYLYSPAFLQVLAPLRMLPFDAFFTIWVLISTGVLLWLVGPIAAALLLIPASYSPVYHDLWFGNIMILTAAALVVGLRYPASWAFILLTKLTPGIGLLWFAVRREWRSLAIALGVTAAIALISFIIAPHLWFEWFGSLRNNAAAPEVASLEAGTWPLRLGASAVLVVVGARFNARWVLPIALFIAQPLTWFIGFVLLIALVGWWRHPALRTGELRTAELGSA